MIATLVIATSLFSADVVVKTAGTASSDEGFSVKDGTSTELFSVEGDGSVQATKGRIQDKTGFVMPVGSLTAFAGATAPTGWLVCDGSAVSRTTYADLFAVIGTTYGTGDGSNTFNLPNLGGRNIVGKGSTTATDTLGETGGEETHTLTTSEMPSHTHNVNPASFDATAASAGSHSHSYDDVYHYDYGGTDYGAANSAGDGDSAATDWKTTSRTTAAAGSHSHTVAVDVPNTTSTATGSGTAHNVLDPYIVLNYIIKY